MKSKGHICADIIGIFKIDRQKYINSRSHPRSYDIISIRLSGKCHFSSKKEDFSIGSGDVLYIPKSAEYTQISEGESIIAIHFLNYGDYVGQKIIRFSPADKEKALSLFSKLHTEWENEVTDNQYVYYAHFYELLHYLKITSSPHDTAIAREKDRLAPAIKYIQENYRKEIIEISRLARLCNLSEPYFRKLFKSAYSTSPAEYISDLKLDFAAHLLKSGLYNVSEASEKAGYRDEKYFSRRFKAHFGLSPKKYTVEFHKNKP